MMVDLLLTQGSKNKSDDCEIDTQRIQLSFPLSTYKLYKRKFQYGNTRNFSVIQDILISLLLIWPMPT